MLHPDDAQQNDVRNLPVERVHSDPAQPKQHFSASRLAGLAAFIKSNGLLQPITVRPAGKDWMIITGERRYRAHILAGARTIRAFVVMPAEGASAVLMETERQISLLRHPEPVNHDSVEQAHAFERQLERVVMLVNCAIKDNQVVAVHKTNPYRADHIADLLALMQKDLRRMELAFRAVSGQASFSVE